MTIADFGLKEKNAGCGLRVAEWKNKKVMSCELRACACTPAGAGRYGLGNGGEKPKRRIGDTGTRRVRRNRTDCGIRMFSVIPAKLVLDLIGERESRNDRQKAVALRNPKWKQPATRNPQPDIKMGD